MLFKIPFNSNFVFSLCLSGCLYCSFLLFRYSTAISHWGISVVTVDILRFLLCPGCWGVTVRGNTGVETQLAWAEGQQQSLDQLLLKKWLWNCSLKVNILKPRVLICCAILTSLCKFLAAKLHFNWEVLTFSLLYN